MSSLHLNAPQTHMDFNEFTFYRNQLLKNINNTDKNLLDLAENNIYKFFPSPIRLDEISNMERQGHSFHVNGNVHRCHLVEDWLKTYHIPQEYKTNIGYSKGVRNSLSTIAQSKNFYNDNWLIPSDIYPFYIKFMEVEGYRYKKYETLNKSYAPFYFRDDGEDDESFKTSNIILITMPLKPLGKEANEIGKKNLKKMISNYPNKVFIIDAVYFNQHQQGLDIVNHDSIHPDMQYMLDLYDLQNVFLLFSTSKNWALPQIMGVTFIPLQFQKIKSNFKEIIIDKLQLKVAYSALHLYHDTPLKIAEMQFNQRNKLDLAWKEIYGVKFSEDKNIHQFNEMQTQAGYLYHINKSVEELYKDNILAIPAFSFGGNQGSIISTLF